MRQMLVLIIFSVTSLCVAQQAVLPYQDAKLSPEARAADLVSRMTLEEKAAQSINTAPAIPRLGVPAYDYWSEGLHGIARSGYATLFPQAIGNAATWDAPLLGQIGTVVSTEARAKFNEAIRHDIHSIYFGLTIWSPNINIFRDPRWGRGQETYGEDPFLTATLGDQFVRGLQGDDPRYYRAIATPKHFAVHSGPESDRHRFNVEPSEHDLWETYLPAFRKTVVEAKAGSIMCAYNSIDGKPACASDLLLKDILRHDWKFDGFVTSDCGAVDDIFEKSAHAFAADREHAAADALAMGTDTNCGETYLALPDAVKQKLVPEADLDRALQRLFVARIKLGLFDPPSQVAYASIPFSENRSQEHLAMAMKASRESIVLLKNDGILPLKQGKYKRVLIVGPNEESLAALEGNYNAVPNNPEMPVDALRKALHGAQVVSAQGSPYAEGLTLPVPRTVFRPGAGATEEGLKAEYFASGDLSGTPAVTRVDHTIDFDWNSAAPVPQLHQEKFSVRWSGTIAVPQAGKYEFAMHLAHCYPCDDHEKFSVLLDGKPVAGGSTPGNPSRESGTPRFSVEFADAKPHSFAVEYLHNAPLFGAGLSLEWAPPAGVLQSEAVAKAAEADLVIATVGLSPELEGEEMPIKVEGFAGGDRTDIKLPAAQEEMLESVAASGKPMVVVLMNGSALALNWAQEHADAIVEAWYPGEFGAKAIAETLDGENNPAGRLPVTFYKSVDQLPPFSDYSMKNRTYRYMSAEPLYRFGDGLSYSTFTYSRVRLSTAKLRAGDPLTVEVDVKNSGKLAGDEVAELYLMPPAAGNEGLSPKLALEGFQRVHLSPGESRKMSFVLDARQLSQVERSGDRVVQAGEYQLSVGGSQPKGSGGSMARFEVFGTASVPR